MKNEPLGPGNPINKPPNDSDLGFTSESRPYKRSYVNFSLPMRDIDKWAFSKKCLYASYPPVSLLMGQAPAGMNATGESDTRFFYDQVRAEQEAIKPKIEKLVKIMTGDESAKVGIEFP